MKRINNFTLETKILPSRAVRLAPFSSRYKMALAAGNVGPVYKEKDENEPRFGFPS